MAATTAPSKQQLTNIPINLPRPRDRSSCEFVQIRKEIYAHFFQGVDQPFAYAI